jgi:hypothetical protein
MANDFTGDADCKALWRFENDSLDSIGGNDWAVLAGTPGWDNVDFKEGSYCTFLEGDAGDDSYLIVDGDLDAGFPFKNGDSNKKISICYWVQLDNIPSGSVPTIYVFDKGGGSTRSFFSGFEYSLNSTNFSMGIGIAPGSSWEVKQHATGVTDANFIGNWYHVGCTYQDSDKTYRIRVWDDNAQAILGSDATGTMTNNINVENGGCLCNATPNLSKVSDIRVDEMVIFGDILTAGEIDEIRGGTFGGGVAAQYYRRHLLQGQGF